MFPPCEMMTKTFLPAVRGLVAHRLKKLGRGQTSIAKFLGITQSAVSQMLAVDEKRFVERLEQLGVGAGEASLLVDTLSDEVVSNPVRATEILYGFWLEMLSKGRFCDYHRKTYPQLANCEICIGRVFITESDEERSSILKSLEKIVKKLESISAFSKLIPEVGTNVVYCVENASTVEDVAGVVGRIVALDDEVRSVGRPAFGGSHHLALVLLTARKHNPNIRAAINLRFSEAVRKAVEKAGLVHAYIEPHSKPITDETVVDDLANLFRSRVKFPDAVLHGGGVGFEPITYLFADDADTLIQKVLKVVNNLLTS